MSAFFEARGLTIRFGGVTAVKDVSFTVEPGLLQAVIGPNGAGKTSLFNLITGFYKLDAGEVFFEGRRISGLPPHTVSRAGIVRTFQNLEIFSNMTALENVVTGAHQRGGYGLLASS